MNTIEPYHQTYTYDTGNNLTYLSHRAKSNTWLQTITLHPNNNRGTETQLSTTDFDANGNLLTLNNIGTLEWHYNNTLNKLNKLTKDDKTTEYYVYDYQGNRIRTVLESNQKKQNQRDYLPSLDISTNEKNQASNTLHIGTHILSEITKNNTQTRYQLASHLQSNTLEINDKAEVISYEHFYPYGGTAIIAGKDQTQVRQKRYRYTGKERDDSSGLSYHGARYLAPWMARWISPDSAGAVDGLNLYVYAGNNPLKYIDPTGHVITIPTVYWSGFIYASDAYMETQELNFWVGEEHSEPQGKELLLSLDHFIKHKNNIVREGTNASVDQRPKPWVAQIRAGDNDKDVALRLLQSKTSQLIGRRNGYYIGLNQWTDIDVDKKRLKAQKLQGGSDFLVGSNHILSHGITPFGKLHNYDKRATPIYWNFEPDSSVALIPKEIFNSELRSSDAVRDLDSMVEREYGMWVIGEDGSIDNAFLVLGKKHVMRRVFGEVAEEIPLNLSDLAGPSPIAQNLKLPKYSKNRCTIL